MRRYISRMFLGDPNDKKFELFHQVSKKSCFLVIMLFSAVYKGVCGLRNCNRQLFLCGERFMSVRLSFPQLSSNWLAGKYYSVSNSVKDGVTTGKAVHACSYLIKTQLFVMLSSAEFILSVEREMLIVLDQELLPQSYDSYSREWISQKTGLWRAIDKDYCAYDIAYVTIGDSHDKPYSN